MSYQGILAGIPPVVPSLEALLSLATEPIVPEEDDDGEEDELDLPVPLG